MTFSPSTPLSSSFFSPLSKWKVNGKIDVVIGCDVGGSGFRLRFSNVHNPSNCLDVPHFKAQTTKDYLDALGYIEKNAVALDSDIQSSGASIAVAGPIANGSVVMTNWKGNTENRTVSLDALSPKFFPKQKTVLLNDLEAGAYGIIAANEQKILKPLFEPLWPSLCPPGPLVSNTRTAVLAMGSGLGVAIILKTPIVDRHYVLSSELGHLQIPVNCEKHEKSEIETKLLQYISDHYYGGSHAIEFEDIASGRGLQLVYQFFHFEKTGQKLPIEQIDAGEVAKLAQKGDKVARTALATHYQFFLRSAKNISTSLCCDSVLLALDNQVKNDWFVRSILDELQDEFYHFIRPDWMKNIRVYGQTKTLNFNILGTTYMAKSMV